MAKKPAAKKKSTARTRKPPARTVKAKARATKMGPKRASARKAVSAARKPAKTTAKRAAPASKVVPKTRKKAAARKLAVKASKPAAKKVAARTAAVKKVTAKVTTRKLVARPAARPPVPPPAARKAAPARPVPALNRERRTVGEAAAPSAPSSLVSNRHASAASSGADELRVKLASHGWTGPAITAGDVDANWEAAETVGDEAPGGDNPTPDQDVVDEIGRALGVEYDDDEELQGGDEIAARDHDRWELDPASSDDFDER